MTKYLIITYHRGKIWTIANTHIGVNSEWCPSLSECYDIINQHPHHELYETEEEWLNYWDNQVSIVYRCDDLDVFREEHPEEFI